MYDLFLAANQCKWGKHRKTICLDIAHTSRFPLTFESYQVRPGTPNRPVNPRVPAGSIESFRGFLAQVFPKEFITDWVWNKEHLMKRLPSGLLLWNSEERSKSWWNLDALETAPKLGLLVKGHSAKEQRIHWKWPWHGWMSPIPHLRLQAKNSKKKEKYSNSVRGSKTNIDPAKFNGYVDHVWNPAFSSHMKLLVVQNLKNAQKILVRRDHASAERWWSVMSPKMCCQTLLDSARLVVQGTCTHLSLGTKSHDSLARSASGAVSARSQSERGSQHQVIKCHENMYKYIYIYRHTKIY